jgi:DNA-binding SARP family transcriptional activator
VEYRILGPLEVRDRGRSISLGTAKQQALLAVLVLHANEFVPRERLIDELWGETPPPTAAKAIQVYVSHLRKLLAHNGDEAIGTRAGGYVLSLDGEGVDARSFERIAREAREHAATGDAEQAASLFREALALWRGPALAGLTFESAAHNEVERLEEERLAVLMDRIDSDLSLGRHEQLVGELEGLVAQHPLRERLRGQLMLALYRSGRQADALRVYREGRETLVEELGLEPSEPLQRLERAILVHDPALEAPAGLTKAPVADRAAPPRVRRRRLPRVLGAAAALLLPALAVTIAVLLRSGEPAAKLLAPNSVGFIDAESGRITKSFAVGRGPSALTLANNSLWVANYRDQTVTRIDPERGPRGAIPVGGHPTGIAAFRDTVWVWTLEGLLVPIRYDVAGDPVSLSGEILRAGSGEGGVQDLGGRLTAGGRFLWIAAPGTTVIRVDPADPRNRTPTFPDAGVQGAIGYHDGEVWVGGVNKVFSVDPDTRIPHTGPDVGVVRDLAFGAGSLWVVSGIQTHVGGVVQALRRIDSHTRMVQATIPVGSDPVAVAVAGHSVWVATRTDGSVARVDPAQNRVVDTIPLGAKPTALVAADDGVWLAVR